METTITEALADIKTTHARLAKRRVALGEYLCRDSRIKDPMEASEGGSEEYLRRERQAIRDLEERIVKIRSAIQAANLQAKMEILGTIRTVQSWLNWRREVATGQKQFADALFQAIKKHRQQFQTKVADSEGNLPSGVSLIVNLDEKALLAEIDHIEETLGLLDGKLSLFNATQVIPIPD
jgi:hypothetical protein